jgi:hypothetical protein
MPLARIITSREGDAAALCEQLHILGYLVEVVAPGSPRPDGVDVEIELDRVPLPEALEYVFQRSKDLGCDVWVAPAALSGSGLPEETAVPEVWQPEALAPTADLVVEDEEEQLQIQNVLLAESQETSADAFEIEPAATAAKRWQFVSTAGRAVGTWFTELGSASAQLTAVCAQLASVCARKTAGLWQSGRNLCGILLAGIVQEQHRLRAALQARREMLRARRESTLRTREAQETALQAAMARQAEEQAIEWAEVALQAALHRAPTPEPAAEWEQTVEDPGAASMREEIIPKETLSASKPPAPAETTALPEASVWVAPEAEAVITQKEPAHTPSRPLTPWALAKAASLWKWTSTTPFDVPSPPRKKSSLRELQWRRAAMASAGLSLAMIVGFAAGMRHEASSLLPSSLPASAELVPTKNDGSSTPLALESQNSPRPALRTAKETSLREASVSVPRTSTGDSPSAPATKLQPLAPAGTQINRAAKRNFADDEVVVRHFGPEVIIRHFERPASPNKPRQPKDGIRYYSDLD